MIKVVILGAGNVAHHLASYFSKVRGVVLVQCYNRKGIPLFPGLDCAHRLDQLVEADVYMMAVSDNAIALLSAQLPFSGRLVAHVAGGVSLQAIDGKNRRGVLYPLQTFKRGQPLQHPQFSVGVEAESTEDLLLLRELALQISDKVYEWDTAQRKKLHLAAVFANNFVNHLYHVSKEVCEVEKLPFEALHPLMLETVGKAMYQDPCENQTGPAMRGDHSTIETHQNMLPEKRQRSIYQCLTRSIQEYYGKKEL